MTEHGRRATAWLLGLAVVLIWGVSFTATRVAVTGIPLVGVAAGVLLLGEALTPSVLIGGAMIIAGVVVSNTGRHGAPKMKPS